MIKILAVTAFLFATPAFAGSVEIRDCGDDYLGSEKFFYDCIAIHHNLCMEVLFEKKAYKLLTYKEMKDRCFTMIDKRGVSAQECAQMLPISVEDFATIMNCYGGE